MISRKMKKKKIFTWTFALTFFTLFTFSSIQISAKKYPKVLMGPETNAIYMRLQTGRYEIKDATSRYIYKSEGDVIVKMREFLLDDSPGNPALPYQIYRVALPPEAVPESLKIEIIHIKDFEFPQKYKIAPAPPFEVDQQVAKEFRSSDKFMPWGLGKKIVEGRNELIYKKDTFYPSEYCQVKFGGELRKWKIATIFFYPIRYNPVKSKLLEAKEINLKISFDRDLNYLKQPKTKRLLRDDTFNEQVKDLILNFDRAMEGYLKPLQEKSLENKEAKKGTENLFDPNYVIIATEEIYNHIDSNDKPILTDFCFHKQDHGFTVMVVTEHQNYIVTGTTGDYTFIDADGGYEDVDGEYPNQRPDKIRKWLQDNYNQLGIQYVLLIGDPDPDNIQGEENDHEGNIPMRTSWPYPSNEHPNDMYYSDLSGNWNYDGDNYLGENIEFTGYKELPDDIDENIFSVIWEGVVDVTGAETQATIYIKGSTEGQTRIWFDKDNDGLDDTSDLILDELEEHLIDKFEEAFTLVDGTYPIKIEYRQSTGDAWCKVNLHTWASDVTLKFKHETDIDNYEDKLEAKYYNTDDLDDDIEPDVTALVDNPFVAYIASGDRGVGGVDFFPEVIVGRIPVYYQNDDYNDPDYVTLENILKKIITYENADIYEEIWRQRVLSSTPYMYEDNTVADYKGCEYLMCNVAPPPLWEWTRIYSGDYENDLCDTEGEIITPCNYDNTVAAWNAPDDESDGRGVVMWRTHGSQTGATHVFTQSRCQDLDDTKPSIVIQTTCGNGIPEVFEYTSGTKKYPLGYSLLKNGAIATISATRGSRSGIFDPDDINISYKNNAYLLYYFAKGIFGNNDIGNVLAHVKEDDALIDKNWAQIFNYNLYGDPSLSLFGRGPARNNDVVFLVDGSGSMVYPEPGKWQAAVDAAVLFYDLMKILRYPTFEDRYHSVVFRWISDPNDTTTVPADTNLQDMSVELTGSTFNPTYTPESYYGTPMGQGLQLAADQFVTDADDSLFREKMIILLSDGKHNNGVDPMDVIQAPEWPGTIKVHTIGLGEDDIEPETIKDIANDTFGNYRISPTPREIEGFFCEILCDLSWKLQDIMVTDSTAPIDQNKAVFIVIWDDPGDSLSFELDPPGDGENITPLNYSTVYPSMDITYHEPASGETHAFYLCENIPDSMLGDWDFVNIKNGTEDVLLDDVLLKVIEDPQTIAEFDVENKSHYTGQPIILTAKITEDHKPMTDLPEVYAELVRSPALAVGTIMAENSPPPDYPPQTPSKIDRTLRSYYLLGVMQKLKIENLSKEGGPRIYLNDKGIGCDLRANDGIYTGMFLDTQYEGSYTFRFRARGKNKNNVTFDRTKTLSEYVKIAASVQETKVEIISVVTDPKENIAETIIRVTPRDRFGSYLGPFRGNLIQAWSDTGTFDTTYKDNKDGSYNFTLFYSIGDNPNISFSVGDVLVADRMEIKPARFPFSLSFHAGITFPIGISGSIYNNSYMFGLDFDYHFAPQWSLLGFLGFNHFKAATSGNPNTHWWNFSINLKYAFTTSPLRPYVNGGFGFYMPKTGIVESGVNAGLGWDYSLNSNWDVEFGGVYHHVFTSGSSIQFFVTHAGLIYRF